MDNNTIVILYDGITGSTNLMSILNKSQHINILPGYNPFGSGNNCTPSFIDEKLNSLHFDVNKKNCFKFRYSGIPSFNGSLAHIIDIFDKFIVLTRNNTFEHVLSEMIKTHTDQANAKLTEDVKHVDPFIIDDKDFYLEYEKKCNYKKNIFELLRNKQFITIDYDVLFLQNTLDEIYDYFNIPSENRIYTGDYKKINNTDRYKSVIKNYEELKIIYENIR